MMKKSNKPTLSWIYKHTKIHLPALLLISVLAAVVSVQFVALAMLSKTVLEIATGDQGGSILNYGILLLLLVVLQVICSGAESILKARISGKLIITLREHLFKQIGQKKFSDISKYHSGDLLNRLTSDVEVLQVGVVNIVPNLVSMVTRIIGCVIALLLLEPKLAIIILVVGVLIPAVSRILSNKYKVLHRKVQQSEGESRSFMQECFANLSVMKTFKTKDFIFDKLNRYLKENYKVKMKRSVLSVFLHLGLYSFFTVGYYAVLLWGAVQIANPTVAITYGTLIAFLQLVSQLRMPLQNISGILPQYYSLLASAERLMQIENLDSESISLESDELQKCCDEFKTIKAENICFDYDDESVIRDLSFEINRGSMTAILGDSGVGKSTIFKLLLNLFDIKSGKLTLNGQTPIDAKVRGIFSYVPQGNMIVSGSVKENIKMCNPNITDEEVINAAKVAEIYDYIITLPNGLDTELSEHGVGFSEGQLQRIAIARAVANDSPILLLDEATSALDKQTEKRVLDNIKALTDKTVILVTHRTSNLNLCDNVINLTE